MVSNASGSSPSREAVDQPPVRRQPLKRRSLSQFYFSKSQSFNCMEDLLRESAFSRSTLLLAKRSQSQKQQLGASFASISEDSSECTSPRMPTPPPTAQPQSPFGNYSMQRVSWDGSHSTNFSPPPSSCCLLSSLSASAEQPQLGQLQEHLHQQWPQPQPIPARSAAWRLQADSMNGANSSCTMADGGAACWSAPSTLATDSLCAALQTTSLSPPQGLWGMHGYSMEFPAAPHHNLVTVGAAGNLQ